MEIEEFGRIKFLTEPSFGICDKNRRGEIGSEAEQWNENLEDEHFFRWTFFVEHRSENGDVGNLKKKKKRKFDNPSFVYFEFYE